VTPYASERTVQYPVMAPTVAASEKQRARRAPHDIDGEEDVGDRIWDFGRRVGSRLVRATRATTRSGRESGAAAEQNTKEISVRLP
jgi:hypothetical protein